MEAMGKHKISAIIAAAGRGERAGFDRNKLLAPLYGAPALWHTLKKFYSAGVDETVVAASKEDFEEVSALAAHFGFKTVLGGKTRTESIINALCAVTGDIVLIHDGARPFLSENLIRRCAADAAKYKSSVCALPATDAAATAEKGEITICHDRSKLYLLQTPQGFFTEDIRRAYSLAGDKIYADDSAAYAEFIGRPHITEGEKENIKLTYASDFGREIPRLVCAPAQRAGFGVDVHSFCEGGGIVLGGVKIDCGFSLRAHSDGDVLLHAVTDALLSAAGLGDIGRYFPDSDPRLKGANSAHMCAAALKEVKKVGYAPVNISISVQAEKPRLSAYADQIKSNVAHLLGIAPENAAVAAGTCEGLGFVGEGLGIAAYAFALLQKIN